MKIIPINNHVLVEPAVEQSAFQSSQQQYEERGKVISPGIADDIGNVLVHTGDYVFFDSWRAAKYKDGEGKEFWVVPFESIRAIETNEE